MAPTMMTMLRLLLHLYQRNQRKENHVKRLSGRKSISFESQLPNQKKKKRAQALLLEHPDNVGLSVWSSFEKVFLDIASFLVEEKNRYAKRDKSKTEFNVTLNEIINFVGLIFLSGYNIRLLENDHWSIAFDRRCNELPESMTRKKVLN